MKMLIILRQCILIMLIVTNYVVLVPVPAAASNLPGPLDQARRQSLCEKLLSTLHRASEYSYRSHTRLSVQIARGLGRVLGQLPPETVEKILRWSGDGNGISTTRITSLPALLGNQEAKANYNSYETAFFRILNRRIFSSHGDEEGLADLIRRRVLEWDSNQELWAFVAPRTIILFSEDSNLPNTYEQGTLIVMNNMFPIRSFQLIEFGK